ncbi:MULTISPECIES: Gfo/Idh/MocA family protein [unclassified Inquilinus]|uniref:Gfo/Idh/MocA family protein n=1 Tax=unclassified Inquilinus TaxID=2645927 RepID=UPI003F8E6137
MAIRNVAVVGLGIGRGHIAEGYSAHPDKFRVEAICDLDSERLSAVGDDFVVPVRTNRFDEILAMPEIEVIDICTPPGVHLDQILAALAAGKQVICEKPLVGSLADLDRVAKAEAAAPGRVMPIFQYRYGDGLQKAKRIIEAGIAGKHYLATVETAWNRGAKYYSVPWRGKLETEFGGVLLTHAIHSHDIMTYLLGPVASVFARTTTRVNPIEVEDCAVASLAMADGSLVSLAATLGSQIEISRLRFCFENVTFESGLKPYAPGDAPWQIIPASPEVAERIEGALADWDPVPSRFAGQLGRYHAALESGGPLPVTLDDARRSLELVTALFASAETGRTVELPIRPDHPKYADWRPQPKAVA